MKFVLFLLYFSFAEGNKSKSKSKSKKENCDLLKDGGFFPINESLNSLDQEDPILIEEVRKMLIPPSDPEIPYNLTEKDPDKLHRVEDLIELLGSKRKGFFFEAGAFDGERSSTSLFFEMNMGWSGLLVEPNPDALQDLVKKQRKTPIFPGCLSTKKTPEIVQFDVSGITGGIINDGIKPGGIYPDPDLFRSLPEGFQESANRRTVRMQCFPLYSILMAVGNPTIDLFSLDIEGPELQVLQSLPWPKVDLKVLFIEINHIGYIFPGSLNKLNSFLKKNGFVLHKSTEIDDIYIKKGFKIN